MSATADSTRSALAALRVVGNPSIPGKARGGHSDSNYTGVPVLSPWLLRLFGRYSRWYLGRHFNSVRLAGELPDLGSGPVIAYSNHASWRALKSRIKGEKSNRNDGNL